MAFTGMSLEPDRPGRVCNGKRDLVSRSFTSGLRDYQSYVMKKNNRMFIYSTRIRAHIRLRR